MNNVFRYRERDSWSRKWRSVWDNLNSSIVEVMFFQTFINVVRFLLFTP